MTKKASARSPLRYPGGKGKLAHFIANTLCQNGLRNCEFVEPFVGGGAVSLYLIRNGLVNRIHINDIDPAVYTFWLHAVNNSQRLCDLVENTPITIEEWYRQRQIQKDKDAYCGSPELAFSTLFLNRTNRSGILWAGPIGGQNQAGAWKLDCRFNKTKIIQQIASIGALKGHILVYQRDAKALLKDFSGNRGRYFFYIDPPYYQKGQSLYLNAFEHCDHKELADVITDSPHQWIVSYDNAPEISNLYKAFERLEYSLQYSVRDKYKGSEVIFYPSSLRISKTANPCSSA